MPPPYKINLTAFETIPAVENVVTDGRSKTEVACYIRTIINFSVYLPFIPHITSFLSM